MTTADQTALTFIADLQGTGFWGSLEIKFEAGNVVLIKKTETLKPNQRNNRGNEYGTK